jgi:hypothetical protein
MYNWRKRGLLFQPQRIPGPDWMREFAQAPCVLPFDDFIRVYFSCRPAPDARGQYVSYSGYVDLDRNDLFTILRVSDTPILPLGGLGTFDEFGTYPVSAIRHAGQVFAYYGGWTRCESVPFNVAIGIGVSDDEGRTFRRLGDGPVLSYAPDEPFVLSGPKIRRFGDLWYLWYIAGRKWIRDNGRAEPIYKIRMATSLDGLQWTRHDKDIIESRLDGDEAQASPDVFFRDGKYRMFFCYRHATDYRGKERGYRIGYAESDDAFNWRRDQRRRKSSRSWAISCAPGLSGS